jgi:hypothetical protein
MLQFFFRKEPYEASYIISQTNLYDAVIKKKILCPSFQNLEVEPISLVESKTALIYSLTLRNHILF